MKRLLRIVLFFLCPIILNAQVELHPIYTSPYMGIGNIAGNFSKDGGKIVVWSGFGFSVWETKTGKLLYSIDGHDEYISYAEFNHKGTAVVTASKDNAAKVWNAETGELLFTLEGHLKTVSRAVFCDNDKRIMTIGTDGNVLLWSARDGKLIANLGKGSGIATKFEIYEEGGRVMILLGCKKIRICDIKTGKVVLESNESEKCIKNVTFGEKGNVVFIHYGDNVRKVSLCKNDVFNSEENSEVSLTIEKEKNYSMHCSQCSYSKQYASMSYSNNKKTLVYQYKTDSKSYVKLHEKNIMIDSAYDYKSITFNPTGTKLIIVNNNGFMQVWDTETWKKIGHYGEEDQSVSYFSCDKTGNHAIITFRNSVVNVVNLTNGKTETILKDDNETLTSTKLDKDVVCLLDRNDHSSVIIINPLTYKIIDTLFTSIMPRKVTYYSEKGRYVALCDSTVKIYNSTTGNLATTIRSEHWILDVLGFSNNGSSFVVTERYYESKPTGCGICLSVERAKVCHYSVFSGKLVSETTFEYDGYESQEDEEADLVNGYGVFSEGIFSSVIYNIVNGKQLFELNYSRNLLRQISKIHKSGKYVISVNDDSSVVVRLLPSGEVVREFGKQKSYIYSLEFCNKGDKIIITYGDGTTKIWNMFTGEMIATVVGNKFFLYKAYFSDDDQKIITHSYDGLTRIYDANQLPYSFTDIPEEEKQTDITLSPNPAQNEIRICFSEPLKEKGEYAILSPTGVQINKGEIPTQSNGFTYIIDNNLNSGTYICLLRINGEYTEEKFVVMR